jgi:endonuclease YncB( thermonuclease family)
MRSTGLPTSPSLIPRALRHVLLVAACLLPLAARADFDATVVTVSDGDSLRVKPAGESRQVVIRLQGVDAPEICQAHGREAREALRARVLGQVVRVHERGSDSYQRLLAGITLVAEPGAPDLGAWLVRQGHAWSWRSRGSLGPYAIEEADAREQRRGLWAGRKPMQPGAFRQAFGPCH